MDKEDNSSNGRSDDKPDTKTGIPARSNVKTKTRRKRKMKPGEWIALIAAIAPIIVALPSLISFISSKLSEATPVIVPTSTLSQTPIFTDTSTFSPSDTPSAIISPSLTSTITATAVPSETMTLIPQPKLIVLLQANKTSGRRPLAVKLDARASYLTDYDGKTYVCRNGTCYYTWKVYSGGQQIGKSVTDSGGTFDYTFGKEGTYMVTVWICRGRDGVDCDGSGTQIIVTK